MALGEGRDDFIRHELIRGEVVEVTPTGGRHSRIAVELGFRNRDFLGDLSRGSVFGADCGFRLERDPDTVRAPDVAFVTSGRLEGVDDRGFLPFAPDLAAEIVSPSDSFREVEEKASMWLSFGARLVWVVEPDLRRVYVCRPGGDRTVLSEADELSGEAVLPGFSLSVADLF